MGFGVEPGAFFSQVLHLLRPVTELNCQAFAWLRDAAWAQLAVLCLIGAVKMCQDQKEREVPDAPDQGVNHHAMGGKSLQCLSRPGELWGISQWHCVCLSDSVARQLKGQARNFGVELAGRFPGRPSCHVCRVWSMPQLDRRVVWRCPTFMVLGSFDEARAHPVACRARPESVCELSIHRAPTPATVTLEPGGQPALAADGASGARRKHVDISRQDSSDHLASAQVSVAVEAVKRTKQQLRR